MSPTSGFKYSMIVAVDKYNGIGKNKTIPWHMPSDLRNFQKITMGENALSSSTESSAATGKANVVIMGRKTWDSIPQKPLKRRINIVITKSAHSIEPIYVSGSLVVFMDSIESAFQYCKENHDIVRDVFVIGGGEIYSHCVRDAELYSQMDKIYYTQINEDFECDTFFPLYPLIQRETFTIIEIKTTPICTFYVFQKIE